MQIINAIKNIFRSSHAHFIPNWIGTINSLFGTNDTLINKLQTLLVRVCLSKAYKGILCVEAITVLLSTLVWVIGIQLIILIRGL